MTPEEFVKSVQGYLDDWQAICDSIGHEVRDEDPAMTMLHAKRTPPNIGVRGVKVGSTFLMGEPMWYFTYNVAQCRELLRLWSPYARA